MPIVGPPANLERRIHIEDDEGVALDIWLWKNTVGGAASVTVGDESNAEAAVLSIEQVRELAASLNVYLLALAVDEQTSAG